MIDKNWISLKIIDYIPIFNTKPNYAVLLFCQFKQFIATSDNIKTLKIYSLFVEAFNVGRTP